MFVEVLLDWIIADLFLIAFLLMCGEHLRFFLVLCSLTSVH